MVSAPAGAHKHLRLVSKEAEAADGRSGAPALDDSQLLASLRAADPTAATALHDRTRPIVARTIARLLGRSDVDSEDLAQLAFIEIVNTIDHFRGDCPLDAWVSVITARVVYKHIRRRRIERRLFSSVPVESITVATAPTRRDLVFRDAMRRVRRHLEAIEENQAWTFMLHDVCGYDLKEIAHITSASVAAAQSRLVRGRRELHQRIQSDTDLLGVIPDITQMQEAL